MTSSRRDFLARSVQLGVLFGAGVPLLQACGGSDATSGGKKTDPIADGLKPEAGPLRVFNYDSYVSPDVVKAFEDKYGVKVEITTFTTDTEALTKLASGAVKIDVHHSMAGTSIDRLINGVLIDGAEPSGLPPISEPAKGDGLMNRDGPSDGAALRQIGHAPRPSRSAQTRHRIAADQGCRL